MKYKSNLGKELVISNPRAASPEEGQFGHTCMILKVPVVLRVCKHSPPDIPKLLLEKIEGQDGKYSCFWAPTTNHSDIHKGDAFPVLVSGRRSFEIYINSSFPLVTYLGHVLRFQDCSLRSSGLPPCPLSLAK